MPAPSGPDPVRVRRSPFLRCAPSPDCRRWEALRRRLEQAAGAGLVRFVGLPYRSWGAPGETLRRRPFRRMWMSFIAAVAVPRDDGLYAVAMRPVPSRCTLGCRGWKAVSLSRPGRSSRSSSAVPRLHAGASAGTRRSTADPTGCRGAAGQPVAPLLDPGRMRPARHLVGSHDPQFRCEIGRRSRCDRDRDPGCPGLRTGETGRRGKPPVHGPQHRPVAGRGRRGVIPPPMSGRCWRLGCGRRRGSWPPRAACRCAGSRCRGTGSRPLRACSASAPLRGRPPCSGSSARTHRRCSEQHL